MTTGGEYKNPVAELSAIYDVNDKVHWCSSCDNMFVTTLLITYMNQWQYIILIEQVLKGV